MNFIQVLKKLEAYSISLPYVKAVNLGDIYEFLNGNPGVKYASVNIDINQSIRNDNLISYSVYLYYVDRLTEDKRNWKEVKTTAEQVLNSIVNYAATRLGDVDDGWVINYFEQQFTDYTAGGYVQFNLEVPNVMGDCLIDEYEDEDESLIERLRELIAQYIKENEELAEILKEILHKLTGEYDMTNISFYVDDSIYKSSYAEETTLGEVKPDDPVKEEFIFIGWAVNGDVKDDDYVITEDTRFDAVFESIKYKCDFYNVGYHSQYSEITDPDVLLQVLNANYEWVSEVNDNTKTFGRALSISGDIYNSVGLASNNYSGYMDITVSKDVKILLASSNNAGTKKTADVQVDDEHIYYDDVNILYDYDLVQNDYIPANIEQYNVIDVKAGSRVIISTPKNKQINVVGIFVEHKDTKASRTIKQQSDIDEYTIAFYGANDGNDLISIVDENEHLEAPDENSWNCITDSSFVFGVTPITQNLEFEII